MGASQTLHQESWGTGERVVLLHGSLSTGPETWHEQRPLAARGYRLVVPDRRGYGGSAALAAGEDYQVDARDLTALLGRGAHLVGHSYGAIGALLAAAAQPGRVRSLVVVEPPCFGVAADDAAVAALVAESRVLWARRELTDRAFLEEFLGGIGVPVQEVPDDLLDHWAGQAGPLRACRAPWDAEVPVADLAAAGFPKVVVSGGHHAAFDAVCDALARAIGADHVVVAGAGHEVQSTGEPFNAVLVDTWRRCPDPGGGVHARGLADPTVGEASR